MWLTDPKTKKKSVSLTIAVGMALVTGIKYLLGGLALAKLGLTFAPLDAALATGVLATSFGLYLGRKHTDAAADAKAAAEPTVIRIGPQPAPPVGSAR